MYMVNALMPGPCTDIYGACIDSYGPCANICGPCIDAFFKKSRPLFYFIFVVSTINCKSGHFNFFLMTRFEPQTSGIKSDLYANWVTTTAQIRHHPFVFNLSF